MKIYVAGKLCTDSEREVIEKVAQVCEEEGFESFVPHRDVGLANGIENVEEIFEGDIKNGFKDVDLVVAVLEGLHVGAGTAWELGYAYAKGIPCIGIKTDEDVKDTLEYLSSILIYSTEIVGSIEKLREILRKFKEEKN